MSDEQEYQRLLSVNPGDPCFADYALYLRSQGRGDEAQQVCISGLSENPQHHRGRLVLARLFYDRGQLPFSIREVEQVYRELPNQQTIRKLLSRLSPTSLGSETRPKETIEQTVSEAEFGFDQIDLLDEKK